MIYIKLMLALCSAFLMGKLVSKIKLPEILGWLIAGMIVGPYALQLVNGDLLQAQWYRYVMSILETVVGLMIGSELVVKQLKDSGKQIIVTTIVQSLSTFIVVTLGFSALFYFLGIPLYVAVIFGAIALATAPAPALSIVKEFNTKGPVTRALIPMAAIDDVVGIIVFFSVISLVSASGSGQDVSLPMRLFFMIIVPVVLGLLVGLLSGTMMNRLKHRKSLSLMIGGSVITVALTGIYLNQFIFNEPMINFMLLGMSLSAGYVNVVREPIREEINEILNPIIAVSLLIVIVNLGMPLNYRLVFGAGLFTLIYILMRSIGKYFGARFGAHAMGLEESVEKFLGLTLLPHSGVSLVFTGIAVTTLMPFDPNAALIIQGTIAAAAVINEIIAVVVSKKAFEWAGEINNSVQTK